MATMNPPKNPHRGTWRDDSLPRFPTGCCIWGRGQQQWIKGDCMWADGGCTGEYNCTQLPLQQCPTLWYEQVAANNRDSVTNY